MYRAVAIAAFFVGPIIAATEISAAETLPAFTSPEFQTEHVSTKIDHGITSTITVTCTGYSKWVLYSVADSQVMGADMEVRWRGEKDTREHVCGDVFSGKTVPLKGAYGYLWGAVDDYIFLQEPDDFGVAAYFSVYISDTGKEWMAYSYDRARGLTLMKTPKAEAPNGVWRVSFTTIVDPEKVTCEPTKANIGCWNQLRKTLGIDAALSLSAPECPKSESVPRALQVALPVTIPDLSTGRLEFISGETSCSLAP